MSEIAERYKEIAGRFTQRVEAVPALIDGAVGVVWAVEVGDEIKVTEADFALLSKAFFSEIETKYT